MIKVLANAPEVIILQYINTLHTLKLHCYMSIISQLKKKPAYDPINLHQNPKALPM